MDIWNDDVADEVIVPFTDVLDMDIDSTNPNQSHPCHGQYEPVVQAAKREDKIYARI